MSLKASWPKQELQMEFKASLDAVKACLSPAIVQGVNFFRNVGSLIKAP